MLDQLPFTRLSTAGFLQIFTGGERTTFDLKGGQIDIRFIDIADHQTRGGYRVDNGTKR